MENTHRVSQALRFVGCALCAVIAISVLAVRTLQAEQIPASGELLSAAVHPAVSDAPEVVRWFHALGLLVVGLLLFLSGFTVFVLWGMLFQIATVDTDERSLRGEIRGVWDGVLPNVNELPIEGD